MPLRMVLRRGPRHRGPGDASHPRRPRVPVVPDRPQPAERPRASAVLRWRRVLAMVVVLPAVGCAVLGAAYAAAFPSSRPRWPTTSWPSMRRLRRPATRSPARNSCCSGCRATPSLPLRHRCWEQSAANSACTSRSPCCKGQVLATTPPNTVFVQIQVADTDAATAVRIADAVAKQAGTTIEALEARDAGVTPHQYTSWRSHPARPAGPAPPSTTSSRRCWASGSAWLWASR